MQRLVRSPAVGAFRQLSTKAAAAPPSAVNHLPVKKIPGINGRYAGAVYTAASKVIKRSILIEETRFDNECRDGDAMNQWPRRYILNYHYLCNFRIIDRHDFKIKFLREHYNYNSVCRSVN